MKSKDRGRLSELIAEATIDCYDEEEQHTGLVAMIEEEVVCPFKAKVVGEQVTVTSFEQAPRSIYAVCERNGKEYRIDLNSLEWTKPYPKGFEWIEAFQAWQGMF